MTIGTAAATDGPQARRFAPSGLRSGPRSALPSGHREPLAVARGQLEALAGVVEDLAGQFELRPLLERILRHAAALLGCDSGSICTVDEPAGTYRKEVDLGVVLPVRATSSR